MAPEHRLRVGIIGAGVSGLSAARSFEVRIANGEEIEYLIVEGADRIGGRVLPVPHEDGFLQHGATFINGMNHPIYSIASSAVGDFDLFEDFSQIHAEGITINREDSASFASFVDDLEDKYTALAAVKPDASVKEVFDVEFQQFMAEDNRESRRVMFESLARFYLSYYEMEWAAPCSKLSLSNFVNWDDGMPEDQKDSSFVLNKMGFKKILDILGAPIPKEKICLGKTVTNIDYSNGSSVKLSYADGTNDEFSTVIVTCSLGHLKRNSSTLFIPSLPKTKLEAIHSLGFGDMQKLFIEYETPFWEENTTSIKTIGSPGCHLFGRGNLFEVVEWSPKVLVLWLSGIAVHCAAKMDHSSISSVLTQHLRMALNDPSIPEPKRLIRHSWYSDPLHLGSYSFLTPESSSLGDANALLAQPIQSEDNSRPLVCFAGEATHSVIYQTVVGAFISGEREAKRILGELN